MPAPTGEIGFQNHAIQLNYVALKELHFESNKPPNTIPESEYADPDLSMGRSDYDENAKTIQVAVKFEMNSPGRFVLRVELVAEFRVDEALFPKDKVHEWANRASFYVILPFLREQVYATAIRAGLKPMMIPLMQVPTFKVEAPTASEPPAFELAPH